MLIPGSLAIAGDMWREGLCGRAACACAAQCAAAAAAESCVQQGGAKQPIWKLMVFSHL